VSTADTTVPPPVPPDDGDAWYAPDVVDQYEVRPGIVATVTATPDADTPFHYRVREPVATETDRAALAAVTDHFADANPTRPRTREGTAERVAAGLAEKYERILDRLLDVGPAARRRIDWYALRDLRCLGPVTALALDDNVEVGDATGDALVVHTTDFAPASTAYDGDVDHLDRILAERIDRHTVPFRGFEIPVVVYRERLLGADAFERQYAVLEPDLLPGDEALVEACKDRIWERNVDGVVTDETAFVRDRAEEFLARQLTARNTRAWIGAVRHRVRAALAAYGVGVPPVDDRYASDRLDDLVYYVLRDYVGDDKLTIPIRDDALEDVEANRVGERVKVVPRPALGGRRMPTNLVFEDETRFTNLVTQLAAAAGVELNASTPSAKVNLEPAEVDDDVTIRCAVALPVISEDGPHVSIRKQAPDPMTPIDLVERGTVPTELVALLWLAFEHHGVVLFSGPTGVGKTTLLNAHMPFIPFDDRPVSIDEGSREVRLPQETGVSLSTRDHQRAHKRVSMADLMTETNYLNPDVEVVAEINTQASFETFAEVLNTGHGVVGTTHAEDVETLVNRVVEQGVPAYLLREVDLVVFPRHVDGDRYVGEVVEFVGVEGHTDGPRAGMTEKADTPVRWNRICARTHDGDWDLAFGPDADAAPIATVERLAALTDRPVSAVEAEIERKHRYVRYLVEEGVDDVDELFEVLSDLRTDEAATVERLRRESD